MPLQNRVDPLGALVSTTSRGSMMGNRGGVLHNDSKEIVRQFKGPRWITCVLEFRGRWRAVMSPRRYTELFFLDEAVAFAAGHRPCAECRRGQFNAFRAAWHRSGLPGSGGRLLAPEMDEQLHPARIDKQGRKVTHKASLDRLPDGCFVQMDGSNYLVWGQQLLLWSFDGYIKSNSRPRNTTVVVLTPRPIVECFRAGYTPAIHDSSTLSEK